MHTVLTIIIWLLIGVATAYFAHQRGRDPFIWFGIGIFLGVLGFILLFLLPPAKEEAESTKNEEKQIQPSPVILEGHVDENLHPAHTYIIKDWFCVDKTRQQLGPIQFDALKSLWGNGKIDALSYVWSEGMDKWKKIEEIPELNQALSNEG